MLASMFSGRTQPGLLVDGDAVFIKRDGVLHIIASPHCHLYVRNMARDHTLGRTRPHATTSKDQDALYSTSYTMLVGGVEAEIQLQVGHGMVLPRKTCGVQKVQGNTEVERYVEVQSVEGCVELQWSFYVLLCALQLQRFALSETKNGSVLLRPLRFRHDALQFQRYALLGAVGQRQLKRRAPTTRTYTEN